MEALERAHALPPHLSAVKTLAGTDVAGGSPSSSTSCSDSHQPVSAFQPSEQPLPKRSRQSRKPPPPSVTVVAAHGTAVPEEANQIPGTKAPGHKRNRRKPTKQWEEEDIRAPGPRAGRRKAAGSGLALRGFPSQAAALDAPEETQADAHSPVSDESTRTRSNSFLMAAERRRSSLDTVSQEAEEQEEEGNEMRPQGNLKRGGPCHVCWVEEAPAWRSGRVDGLFAGGTLCNKHGTLDKRGRLWMYCDEERIIELHASGLTDEQKAAASKKYLKDPRAAATDEEEEARMEVGGDARSRVRRQPVKVVKRPAKADASQPWGATSPSRMKAASQAIGGRKRKAPSGVEGDDAAAPAPAMASQKRLCFGSKTAPALSVDRDGRSNVQLSSSEEVEAGMDIDTEKLCAVDAEMEDAVASLLSMRKSGSSDMEHFVI